ncbi:MAG: aldehyde dehydrogenase family protein, partial [Anaerolineales bacterium]|nr:aldehyde dehydrogenase family protein [Anaerolineales bacterium]
VEMVQALKVGVGTDAETAVGPLINPQQLAVVERHVADAAAKGADILVGGERLIDLGPQFYAPTVLSNVNHDMAVMNEESFGPVMAIMVVKDKAEAIRHANCLPVGLVATVWTGSRARGEQVARQLNMGMVWINDSIIYVGVPQMPYGGVKEGGWGRHLSHHGLHEMTNTKTIVSTDSEPQMWWFPYSEQKLSMTRMFFEMTMN